MSEIKPEAMPELKKYNPGFRAAYIVDMDPDTNTLLTRGGDLIVVPEDFISDRRAPGYLVLDKSGSLLWSPCKESCPRLP